MTHGITIRAVGRPAVATSTILGGLTLRSTTSTHYHTKEQHHAVRKDDSGHRLGAFVVMAPFATQAQTTTDKVENKMEQAKDKGQEHDRGREGRGQRQLDHAKTKIALFADQRVKGSHVSVDTKDGVVHLRGKVESDEAKSAAAEVAKGIDGAKSVKNNLQMVSPAARKTVDVSDKDITKAVQSRLAQDAQLKKVGVRVDDGVVTLTGEVASITVAAKASERVRTVSGVKSVKNELTLRQVSK